MSGRHTMLNDRKEGSSAGFLRHYPSTPHLESFSKSCGVTSPENSHRSFNHHPVLGGASSNVNLMANSYMPKTNFSTFMQQKKPIPPPKVYGIGGIGNMNNNNGNMNAREKSRYQDDPNPYKVSCIDEYRIKVNDPFSPNKSCASHRNSQMFSFYTAADALPGGAVDDGVEEDDDEEDEDVRDAFGQMEIRSAGGRSLYEETLSCNGSSSSTKVHRSATLKSSRSVGAGSTGEPISRRSHHRSGSASVSASSTGTGEIDIDGEFIIPEPDYDGFHHHRVGSSAGDDCDGSGGGSGRVSGSEIIIPGPISDSSCTGSEGYSSVSAATSSSCSASEPDPYAVPNTGRNSSSPDEGSILEANDSGIETPTRISEKDHMKIEYALMGRKTSIFVADCLANLYCMRKSNFVSRPNSSLSNQQSNSSYTGQLSSPTSTTADGEWVLKYTGVPVLLLDLGETKSRDKRRIQIVLAELGSGLALWKDVIDNLSSYKVMEGSHTFHTMHLSTDHTKIIGLSFDDEECAELFYQRVEKLTSDFANISLSGSKVKSKGKKDKTSVKSSIKSKFVKPKKSEISQPCCFNHISSLTSNDKKRFPSLQNFVLGGRSNSTDVGEGSASGGLKSADQASVVSSSSHEDFVSMSPLALADSHGSDMHF